MTKKEPLIVSNYKELQDLNKRYLKIQRRLEKTRSSITQLELKEHLDDLKEEMGWKLLDLGEYENGLALYKSLPWETHGEGKYNGMVRALVEMQYYDEARRLLEKGLKEFPESYVLWIARGVLDQRLGYNLESLRCFQFALKYTPEGQSEALFNVASALSELGHREEALKVLQDLVRKHPEEARYLVGLAACSLDMGYPKDAVKYYRMARKTGYSTAGIYQGLCCAYSDMGLKKEAMEEALEGLTKFPDEDPGLYENMGELYLEMGWINESRDILNEGLKRFPKDEGIKEMLSKVDDKSDDPGGNKPTLPGLILFMALLHKKFGKRKP
ncbi:MAG TPA: tetratricopeptide repeat protein [Thermodesulfobacteriota bacterium]|nr:tetratricopeptide repeat protein [Thermodesulfobacteriota bacterium]